MSEGVPPELVWIEIEPSTMEESTRIEMLTIPEDMSRFLDSLTFLDCSNGSNECGYSSVSCIMALLGLGGSPYQ